MNTIIFECGLLKLKTRTSLGFQFQRMLQYRNSFNANKVKATDGQISDFSAFCPHRILYTPGGGPGGATMTKSHPPPCVRPCYNTRFVCVTLSKLRAHGQLREGSQTGNNH